MKHFLSTKSIILISALFLALNCYTPTYPPLHVYEGPHLSKKKVGIYYCTRSIKVKEIDGKKLSEIMDAVRYETKAEPNEDGEVAVYVFYFLPGEHTLQVDFKTEVEYRGEWLLKFSVEAGHIYETVFVKKDADAGEWISGVYIKDLSIGKIVSEVIKEEEGEEKNPFL